MALKHAQNNIKSCEMIGRALKNSPSKRLAHLRWTNPKTKYSLTHTCYCISQIVRECGNKVVNAQQKAVAYRAGNDSIARRCPLRLSRVVLMKKQNIPSRAIEAHRFIYVDVANSAKTMEHDGLSVGGT